MSNTAGSIENIMPIRIHTSQSEGNSNFYDIGSNDNDIADTQSTSQIPSPNLDSVTFQTPEPTDLMTNIPFLCNPLDEHINLRQPSMSELFGDNLSPVRKRSWAKDSTCKQVHIILPI